MTQLLEDLPRAAHTHVLLQARDLLARAGTVESLELEPLGSDALCVRGTVIAPHGARFHPSIEWHPADRQRFQHGLCLCPTQPGRPCLHQCVLLLAVAGAIDHQPGRGITGVDEWMVRRWLEGVERAAQPPVAAAPAARQLLYLLQPQGVGVRLELWSGRPRKQGGFGHLQRLQGCAPPPWAEPLDRSILALLAAHPAAGEGGAELAGEPGGDLIALLLRSERLFWASAEQPLAGAELRSGRLDWREDTQGAFPVLLDDSRQPLWLLPTEPPYYIDEREQLIGPLSLPEPVPVVEKLLASPHFSPIAQRALVGDFATLAARGTLPLPPSIHTRELQGATPRPVLRLDSRQMLLWGRRGQERRTVHSASAWFDYASERVPALPAAATLVRVVDGEVLQLRRDSELEAEYLARLQEFEPLAAQRVVQTPAPPPNVFTLADADDWLDAMTDLIPRLEVEGWRIEYAPTFQLRPLEIEGWYGEAEDSGTDWFELNLGIMHEGRRIDLLPLLVSALRRLPALDQRALLQLPDDATFPVFAAGGVFQLPLARLRPILQTLVELFDHEDSPLDERGRLRLARLDAARLVDLDLPWLAGDRLLALGRQLRDFSGIVPVPPPAGLQAELRGYQREGLDWLCFLREFGFAGILADDMGLGKTVQTLALLQHERERHPGSGPSLLVAPTSLLHNWRREAARFAPGLKVVVLHGLDRAALWREAEQADLVITSYSLLPRDEGRLSARQWHYLVFDEAQYLKNPRAKATEVARRLQAGHRLALTGTPMENHLGELWSIFDVLMPHFLGSEARFRRLYRLPVERQGDEQRRQQLASRVAPFLLRRTKEQVAAELPPKTEIVRAVMLEGAQRDLYETIRLAMDEKVRAEVASKGLARSHIVVLEALLKLRQVCCDPRLVKLAQAGRVKQSAKLELLMELLPELLEEGRRVLLFSQFTSMLALIQQALDARGIPYVTLTGETVDRVTPVDRFQSGEVPLFLISLKAGGVGLNLTAADTVIHYDPWWNPAVERQATDRAHRIGQDKPVFVYKLITEGTVEEKILELQGRKAALAEGVYGQNSELASQLDAADLSALLGPLS